MKAVAHDSSSGVYLAEVEKPEIRNPEDILIKICYASICGFDMMLIRGEATQGTNEFIGHEASGIVEAVGGKVSPDVAVPGDRVTIEFRSTCGVCDQCRSGRAYYCVNSGGSANFMSEYIVVDQKRVYRLPDSLSLKEGCLTEPLVMGMYCLEKANLEKGKSMIILGVGAMGLIILKMARKYPLSQIVVVEPVAEKREMALRFGADHVVDPNEENAFSTIMELSDGRGYDTVIEASGSKRSVKLSFQMLARGGALVVFGLYGMDFELGTNLFQLYWKDASIHGVGVPGYYFPDVVKVAPQVKLEEVITALYPYEQAPEAFRAKATGRHAKVMLDFTETR